MLRLSVPTLTLERALLLILLTAFMFNFTARRAVPDAQLPSLLRTEHTARDKELQLEGRVRRKSIHKRQGRVRGEASRRSILRQRAEDDGEGEALEVEPREGVELWEGGRTREFVGLEGKLRRRKKKGSKTPKAPRRPPRRKLPHEKLVKQAAQELVGADDVSQEDAGGDGGFGVDDWEARQRPEGVPRRGSKGEEGSSQSAGSGSEEEGDDEGFGGRQRVKSSDDGAEALGDDVGSGVQRSHSVGLGQGGNPLGPGPVMACPAAVTSPEDEEERRLLAEDEAEMSRFLPSSGWQEEQGREAREEEEAEEGGGSGGPPSNESGSEQQFWKQPRGLGLVPHLRPSRGYAAQSLAVLRSGRYIEAVVTGGLNQMRLQIGNAVVIARIMNATLVVPVLQENAIWHDRSEFADLFDVAHFKRVLARDVRVVTALPPHYLRTSPQEWMPPAFSTPRWFLTHLRKPLRSDHVVLLRGLDQSISPDLPRDLQKLRCKVEFHALRFVPSIRSLGRRLAERMSEGGRVPYLALHLRLERDVWVRTGCSPGLGPGIDREVEDERRQRPELLTSRKNLTAQQRFHAGLCPLTAANVAWLLRGLGAPNRTRVFWAGGEPLGGVERALAPLRAWFGAERLLTKESLARPGELEALGGNANMLAAVDLLVCLHSTVFMPSHGGNMAHVIQGHRAYFGHRKVVMPNKRRVVEILQLSSGPETPGEARSEEEGEDEEEEQQQQQHEAVAGAGEGSARQRQAQLTEAQVAAALADAHKGMLGQPHLRTPGKDAILYPFPDCMCQRATSVPDPRLGVRGAWGEEMRPDTREVMERGRFLSGLQGSTENEPVQL